MLSKDSQLFFGELLDLLSKYNAKISAVDKKRLRFVIFDADNERMEDFITVHPEFDEISDTVYSVELVEGSLK